jgi:hypothetical protein
LADVPMLEETELPIDSHFSVPESRTFLKRNRTSRPIINALFAYVYG